LQSSAIFVSQYTYQLISIFRLNSLSLIT